eukprot:TRINITY_DN84_c0_g1_i4.p2 TRINITY_DN84_c0_g1~~TRINITY_DN84_c0_g1_i4.p2  ORF type:complete len:170 (-),score=0.91 TRINITY_DN84_c0_g1_i4:1001-1510(-)
MQLNYLIQIQFLLAIFTHKFFLGNFPINLKARKNLILQLVQFQILFNQFIIFLLINQLIRNFRIQIVFEFTPTFKSYRIILLLFLKIYFRFYDKFSNQLNQLNFFSRNRFNEKIVGLIFKHSQTHTQKKQTLREIIQYGKKQHGPKIKKTQLKLQIFIVVQQGDQTQSS